jgi:predicted transcriptional regulator
MNTKISAQNERYLEHVVAKGTYRDLAEAIDQAVELLKRRDTLRDDVRGGIEQADRGELLDADRVFRRLEERARQIEADASHTT